MSGAPAQGTSIDRENWLRNHFCNQRETPHTIKIEKCKLTDDDAEIIADELKRNLVCKVLSIRHNNIGDAGVIAILGSLEVNTTLEHLMVDYNNIRVAGARTIAAYLKRNTSLKNLSLDRNDIGSEGAIAVADALEVNSKLICLAASRSNIGKNGAVAFAEALKVNRSLKNLLLHGNNITSVGALAFGEALKVNCCLELLFIGENNIDDAGTTAFVEMIQQNRSLNTLSLIKNNISNEGAERFAKALTMNATLDWLDLNRNNNINNEGAAIIARIQGTLRMNKAERLFRILRNCGNATQVDILAFLPRDDKKLDSVKARQLGQSLLENTVVTELIIPVAAEWKERDINGNLRPLLRYIKESQTLRTITYVFRKDRECVDILRDVVAHFLAAVTNRSSATDFKLIVGVKWLADRNNMRVFETLMLNKEYTFLKKLSVVDDEDTDGDDDVLDRNEFIAALQDNKTIERLSFEVSGPCVKFLKSWKSSAHRSGLRAFSIKVKDVPTLLQLFDTFQALVHLQEYRLEMAGEAVVAAWRSRQSEWLAALKRNGSLQRMELVGVGNTQLEVPRQIQLQCHRNAVMPRQMKHASAHNPDMLKKAGAAVPGSVPPLSCYAKLFHQSQHCPAVGAGWMLRGMLELGDAVCDKEQEDEKAMFCEHSIKNSFV